MIVSLFVMLAAVGAINSLKLAKIFSSIIFSLISWNCFEQALFLIYCLVLCVTGLLEKAEILLYSVLLISSFPVKELGSLQR